MHPCMDFTYLSIPGAFQLFFPFFLEGRGECKDGYLTSIYLDISQPSVLYIHRSGHLDIHRFFILYFAYPHIYFDPVLPRELLFSFLVFSSRNPGGFPLVSSFKTALLSDHRSGDGNLELRYIIHLLVTKFSHC